MNTIPQKRNPTRAPKRKRRLLLILPPLLLLVLFLLLGLNNALTTTTYTLTSDKLTAPLRIALITDLHSCAHGESQRQLLERIRSQSPDILLMSGDIADDALPDARAEELLRGIAGMAPCYYVTGNHEFWSRRVEEQKAMFRAHGAHVLEGDRESLTIRGNKITVCGVDDPAGGARRFEGQLKAIAEAAPDESYTILLSHRPERFDRYAQLNVDLVLSGHAHGGQWRIPYLLPNGVYAPNQGFFPKYTTGMHERNGVRMIVSRGLSRESTPIPRFHNPPELVIIDIAP